MSSDFRTGNLAARSGPPFPSRRLIRQRLPWQRPATHASGEPAGTTGDKARPGSGQGGGGPGRAGPAPPSLPLRLRATGSGPGPCSTFRDAACRQGHAQCEAAARELRRLWRTRRPPARAGVIVPRLNACDRVHSAYDRSPLGPRSPCSQGCRLGKHGCVPKTLTSEFYHDGRIDSLRKQPPRARWVPGAHGRGVCG